MRHLIVLPAFNEEEALPQTVARLQTLPQGYELLIVNDGSRDRTRDVATALARTSHVPLHVVHLPVNGGIGVAVQTGFRFALADGGYHYVLQFDADGQHDADYIRALVDQADRAGLDLCLGSRFLHDFGPGSRSTFARRLGIRFFAGLIGLMSGAKVTDPTSGFRCLGPRAWRRFAEAYPEDYPEPESLFWCARNGLRVGELPVRMFERQGGVSSIRRLKAAYYMVKVSLAILFDRLRRPEAQRPAPLPDPMINAELLMLVGGCGAFLMTLYWVRVRELRERYAVGWLGVATLLLLVGLFPDALKAAAEWAHLSYPALVLFVALGLIYVNSFFVSVALTRQYRWAVRLTQQMALLEERLRRLETAAGRDDDLPAGGPAETGARAETVGEPGCVSAGSAGTNEEVAVRASAPGADATGLARS